MKVLMSVANILLDVDFNNAEMLNDAAKIAFNRAKTAYEDHFSGGETYIDDDDYPGDSILWGAKEPEKLIRVVSHWNEDIRQDFKKLSPNTSTGVMKKQGKCRLTIGKHMPWQKPLWQWITTCMNTVKRRTCFPVIILKSYLQVIRFWRFARILRTTPL